MDGIVAREFEYLRSWVQLGIASQQVVQVSFPDSPAEDAGEAHDLLDRIGAYLEGVTEDFEDVPVALTVPTDHRAVLTATRDIPYGKQVRVERLATMAGLNPDDEDILDTVRAALAENPVPIVIPDHRVRDGPSGAPPEIEQRLRSLEDL